MASPQENGTERAARHRSSHVSLLQVCPTQGRSASIDAVIVPTHRPVNRLRTSVELADSLNCPILILCSGAAEAGDAAEILAGRLGVAATVTSSMIALGLETERLSMPSARPYLDTGTKRNVGLMVARMLGWQRVLFIDDDIEGLTPAAVGVAAGVVATEDLTMVGWRYREFPDNSVVCHALRSSGRPQDVFIGSGALLVAISQRLPFFPAVYNEDWLFWHDDVARHRVGLGGDVRQLPYEPFDVARATREEFGDVMAEGLFNLIHERRPVSRAERPYFWRGVLQERRILVEGVLERLGYLACSGRDARQYEKELLAVEASWDQLGLIEPDALAEFVIAWRNDLGRWNARLGELHPLRRITDALRALGITDLHSGRR
jgi:hypothetical protein